MSIKTWLARRGIMVSRRKQHFDVLWDRGSHGYFVEFDWSPPAWLKPRWIKKQRQGEGRTWKGFKTGWLRLAITLGRFQEQPMGPAA